MLIEIKKIFNTTKAPEGTQEVWVEFTGVTKDDLTALAVSGNISPYEQVLSNSVYSEVTHQINLVTSPEKLIFLLDKLVDNSPATHVKFDTFYISVGYLEDGNTEMTYGKYYASSDSITMLNKDGEDAILSVINSIKYYVG